MILLADSGPDWVNYSLNDLVVDSVVILTNEGVTVTRHYVNPDLFIGGADVIFWQLGMGTMSGPLLERSGPFHRSWVNDTVVYNIENNGLPGPGGIGQICWPLPTSINDLEQQNVGQLLISSRPTTESVQISCHCPEGAKQVTLYDPIGRKLLSTTMQGRSMDLHVPSIHGVFTVVVVAGDSRFMGRVIIH